MMRVLVLHNMPLLPPDHPHTDSEAGVLDTVAAAVEALRDAGLDVEVLALGRDPQPLWDCLSTYRAEVVLNLFEGIPGDPNSEIWATRLLEESGVAFTGSGTGPLRRSMDKTRLRRLLLRAGLPVPEGFVVERLPLPSHPVHGPVIVKPACRHASEGITQESVVTDRPGLEARVAAVLETFGPPVIVEQLLTGREFLVAVTELPELRTLPILEWRYVPDGTPRWPIATYDAKWHPGTADYDALQVDYPARNLPEPLEARLVDLATRAHRLLGCRDYTRVDMRLAADGSPVILEVNANPDLSATACLAGALGAANIDHGAFIVELVRVAASRARTGVLAPANAASTA